MSMDRARQIVGGSGELFFFCIAVFATIILWKIGILGAFGEAFGVIFHALGQVFHFGWLALGDLFSS